MPRLALFAYGSLVSSGSAAMTLGRPVLDVVPARLPGWRRRWSQGRDNLSCEKTFARCSDGSLPHRVLGLNIEPADDGVESPNGALLELSEDELLRLDARELRYDRFEVEGVAGHWPFDRVFAYRAKQIHYYPEPPEDAVVLATYVRRVESAFTALGEEQLRLYLETTGPPPVEVIEPVLVRDRIPPGNPREW
jgi:hypothetical protein